MSSARCLTTFVFAVVVVFVVVALAVGVTTPLIGVVFVSKLGLTIFSCNYCVGG